MISIPLLVVFVLIGAGLGVGYNFLVIKKYPQDRRKGAYVVTVIIFLIVTAALFSIISVKLYVDKAVPAYSSELIETIKKDHSNVGFVKNGLNLTGINNDVSRLNNTLADIKKILPSHTEFGELIGVNVTKGLYDFLVDIAMEELQKKFAVVKNTEEAVSSFADENNYLTVSSVVNGLQNRAMIIANVVLLFFAVLFIVIFLVYIIKSINIFLNERKAADA